MTLCITSVQAVLDIVTCELRIARKSHGGHADEAQNELNHWCLDALEEGKKVVRLKIGDPFLFGRGGEEVCTASFSI
jgi:uroporphyrin-III C-methyltransferase